MVNEMNFKQYLESIKSNVETFDIGKNLSGDELKDALSKAVKKCKHDHRGVDYDEKSGKVTYT